MDIQGCLPFSGAAFFVSTRYPEITTASGLHVKPPSRAVHREFIRLSVKSELECGQLPHLA
jgi:hypothetical protein